MTRATFPARFVWGAATSAYQIEGATQEDGRGESIWDRFARVPKAIEDGSSGDRACDHYHRFRDDVALMKRLGVKAYRFSIAWPRIFPKGRGRVNERGLDFYSALVDELLKAEIEPYVTLYHWDLPQVLQDEGGWTQRSTAEAFAEYAAVMGRSLGGRVKNWITHNEPWCASLLGHQVGRHAPGLRDWKTGLHASHYMLLSHGWAVSELRKSREIEVGITLNLAPVVPASPSAADYEAYRHFDGYFNRWFLEPLFHGHYPADMLAEYSERGLLEGIESCFVNPSDLRDIAVPTDFLGVNYYNRTVMRSDKIGEEENLPRSVFLAPESEWTEMGWEVYPEGLLETLLRVHNDYGPKKIFITENGASYSDSPGSDGRVADLRRIKFIRDHLVASKRAIDAGVPLAGYFVWSLLDNFEWDRGYTQRFGITWIDYETQQRVPKESAYWYRGVISENAVTIA
jgi:beta-glucosidase